MRRCLNCGDANVTLCLLCSICQIGFYLLFHSRNAACLRRITQDHMQLQHLFDDPTSLCGWCNSHQESLPKISTIIINMRLVTEASEERAVPTHTKMSLSITVAVPEHIQIKSSTYRILAWLQFTFLPLHFSSSLTTIAVDCHKEVSERDIKQSFHYSPHVS